jgi:hypothetical protein
MSQICCERCNIQGGHDGGGRVAIRAMTYVPPFGDRNNIGRGVPSKNLCESCYNALTRAMADLWAMDLETEQLIRAKTTIVHRCNP